MESPGRVRITLKEWQRCGPTDAEQGSLLSGLYLGVDPAVRGMADRMARIGALTITEVREGLHIAAGSFVGRLAVGPLDVTIVPKIAWDRWLTIFGYALGLGHLDRSERSAMPLGPSSLRDILLQELVGEAGRLIARGLHRDYVPRHGRLGVPKGRMDFRRLALQGGITDATIPCRYTRRSDDTKLNRLLLAGLFQGARVSHDAGLRSAAHRRALDLEARRVVRQELSNVLIRSATASLDRRTGSYVPLCRLIEVLYEGDGITLDDVEEAAPVRLPGFALDMNRLWQRLLTRVLAEWSGGVNVLPEFRLNHLFVRDEAFAPRPRAVPTPRPDFAVFRGGQLLGYLDAKYRDLWSESLPREMLYQVALYAAAQAAGPATMLYPTEDVAAAEERFEMRDPVSTRTRASVALRPVHLSTLESLITDKPGSARERNRQRFAASLLGVPG